MNHRKRNLVLLGASVLLVAGCGTTPASSSSPTSAAAAQPSSSSAGMSMKPGESMAGMSMSASPTPSPTAAPTAAGEPTAATKMVCGKETQDNIAKILALSSAPHTVSTWTDQLYTCTYHLAVGPLVMKVKESASPAAARSYFDSLQKELASTSPIEGLANLGLPAFKTDQGGVVFVKDNMTLYVDATKLPAKVGPHGVARSEFSYELATAVLACWQGA
ncbi:hypothetical protein IV498_05355 [Paenarthrobacter sp. Z7-10]|uniref:hypothetical protein n=1 Tax=Paenarthrobacter sp. Z7-10 TaxID=2787635 RepID=UPI0022A96917|nr:hypothetical protein [Paenarthrobacter sp. Z7-10]MCZ2402624.1 hypothetical protein [Paenarthrobacter sp. Z7-10]